MWNFPEGFLPVLASLVAMAVIANMLLQLRINWKKVNGPERRTAKLFNSKDIDVIKNEVSGLHDYIKASDPKEFHTKIDEATKLLNQLVGQSK
jgi:hypothetical protein